MIKRIHNTKHLYPFLGKLARIWLKIIGWKTVGEVPPYDKCVIIAAPHTSNWDFVCFIPIMFALQLPAMWMAKHTVFIWPIRWLLKYLGGIPINRTKAHRVVDQAIDVIHQEQRIALIITPKGTRSPRPKWKTGFYHIAHGANVPISLGFLDLKTKTAGFKEVFTPSGDIDQDLPIILQKYREWGYLDITEE